jgi:hypothetical protein
MEGVFFFWRGGERNKNQSKVYISQALVAHVYNPSYSGGRDQEDGCSKPAWANSL